MEELFTTGDWLIAIITTGAAGFTSWVLRVLWVKVQASISRREAVEMIADKIRPLEESQKRTEQMVNKLLDLAIKK